MCVEGIVKEFGARENVRIVRPDVREPLADRPETGGFGRHVDLCREVRAVNDEREPRERGIAGEAIGDELLERASALRVRVGMAGARGIEPDGAVALLDAGDFAGLDEQDLRLRDREIGG